MKWTPACSTAALPEWLSKNWNLLRYMQLLAQAQLACLGGQQWCHLLANKQQCLAMIQAEEGREAV
jgi:hypothetical protein